MSPTVSVIIPVHNTEPYLDRCLESVARQSIGTGRLEIIAVDDGSTDGSAAELDRLATRIPCLTVLRQEASGAAGRPRNTGLDHATGEYVFFLDSDDHLGEEALDRMVAMAERNDSDIVLGKWVGENGRHVRHDMFRFSQARADLFRSRIYHTLAPFKLFRRALIERLDLRFPEDVRIGEDQQFVATAYLNAKVISVVAGYDCYYQTSRPDGSSLTQLGADPYERLPQIEHVMEIVAAHTEPGPGRDLLITRHIRSEVLNLFDSAPLTPELCAAVGDVLDRWLTDDIRRRLPVRHRLRAYCVQHGLHDELAEILRFQGSGETPAEITEDGRGYLAHPLFRAGPIPDEVYEATYQQPISRRLDAVEHTDGVITVRGRARLGPDEQTAELILRERTTGVERRSPIATGFATRIDLADLATGLWDVSVEVTVHGITEEGRLGRDRAPGLDTEERTWSAPRPVCAYFTKPYGNLTLDVGATRARRRRPALSTLSWAPGEIVVITGRLGVDQPPGEAGLRLGEHTFPAEASGDHGFTIEVPVRTLPPGRWKVEVAGRRLPGGAALPSVHWLRGGRPMSASVTAGELRIARITTRAVAKRLLRPLIW